MYWNGNKEIWLITVAGLIETWDVLKFKSCGEQRWEISRLIETWDVLKWLQIISAVGLIKINRNMRCIEIMSKMLQEIRETVINRNMRCIEIGFCSFF